MTQLIDHDQVLHVEIPAETSDRHDFKFFSHRMYLNGELMALTAAHKPGYFDNPRITFELWGTWACLTKEGDGMRDVEDYQAQMLIIHCPGVGHFRVRKMTDEDRTARKASFRGYMAEPIDI